MIQNFPRVTKCIFYKYGPSAQVETVDALCVLPLNIINEKIFIILWFWFMALIILTLGLIAIRAALLASPFLRYQWIMYCYNIGPDCKSYVKEFTKEANYGDWFLLLMIGKFPCQS